MLFELLAKAFIVSLSTLKIKKNNTMDEKIKLPENVMLIDVAFLNFAIQDLRLYFEEVLHRELQVIDFSQLICFFALDADYKEEPASTQVLMIYDSSSTVLEHCTPSDLKTQLDGAAFNSQWGEFAFASVPTAEMINRADLFTDLLQIVLNSSDVKRVIVLSYNDEYGEEITPLLQKDHGKEVVQFRMQESDQPLGYRWEMLPYPIMQALGIRGDELK